MPSRSLVAIIVILALTAGAAGQQPAFGVASVRRNVDGGNTSFTPRANGQLIATNTPLRTLILRAYGLHDSQLIDAPAWTAVERFDIDARAETAPPGPDALMPMLRTLLAERFQLKARMETRQLPA
ncbi:MAG TPA: TIGR03435 family protein, partial [Vicinamibacterales bacterium]|nr:TIGR03435 family protein [Vicinamibacterales bacterium]